MSWVGLSFQLIQTKSSSPDPRHENSYTVDPQPTSPKLSFKKGGKKQSPQVTELARHRRREQTVTCLLNIFEGFKFAQQSLYSKGTQLKYENSWICTNNKLQFSVCGETKITGGRSVSFELQVLLDYIHEKFTTASLNISLVYNRKI